MYLLDSRKKPPVISEPKKFTPPAGPASPKAGRGREVDFSIDRDASPPKAPWLMAGLMLAATAGLFGASMKYNYLLGQVVTPIVGLMTVHGLFKGGFRKAVMLPITIVTLGFLAANPMIFDPIVQRITGGPSPMGNYIACAIVATIALWLVGKPVKAIRRKVIMKRPLLRGADRFFGTGIGFAEGALLSLIIMWASVLVEPQARQVAVHPNARPAQRQFAGSLLQMIGEIDRSPLKPIVRDANLLEEFPSLTEPLKAMRADGSVDPSKLSPEQLEGMIEFVENVGGEKGKAMAEQLRTVQRNQQKQAEAYKSLPKTH